MSLISYSTGRSIIDLDVLAIHIALLAQSLPQGFVDVGNVCERQHAYARKLARLLCLARARGGKKRSRDDQEVPALDVVHASPFNEASAQSLP